MNLPGASLYFGAGPAREINMGCPNSRYLTELSSESPKRESDSSSHDCVIRSTRSQSQDFFFGSEHSV
jgi:hypothetical protein